MKQYQLLLEGIPIDVQRKRIKHVHFAVYPPSGRVRVSAPIRLRDDVLHRAVADRLEWIRHQRARIAATPLPVEPQFHSGETHFLLGQPHRLVVTNGTGRPRATVGLDRTIDISASPAATTTERRDALHQLYRQRLREVIPPLLARWEQIVGVKCSSWHIRRMRTKWGTCNTRAARIWLNLDLATYPPRIIEYILVHELVHLHERRHNARFRGFMDRFLPDWRDRLQELKAGLET